MSTHLIKHSFMSLTAAAVVALAMGAPARAQQQMEQAPDRNRGEGPFGRLIIRGVTLIDGAGSPPQGPVDIVIEEDRIV